LQPLLSLLEGYVSDSAPSTPHSWNDAIGTSVANSPLFQTLSEDLEPGLFPMSPLQSSDFVSDTSEASVHYTSPSLSSFVDSATSHAQYDERYLSDDDSSAGCEDHVEDAGSALEVEDVTQNLLFLSRSQLFPFNSPDSRQEEFLPLETTPPAFYEHPIIRLAYVRAFIAHAFHGATHGLVKNILSGSKSTIQSFITKNPTTETEFDLLHFAETLTTVEQRLGLNTDDYIKYFFVCDICWDRHKPDTLYKLRSPICSQDSCTGMLYSTKRLADGKEKRTPIKILPYVRFTWAIQRILARPGKWEDFQHWRQPGDEPGQVPPQSFVDWESSFPPDRPMQDIYDGWAWRAIQANLERRRSGRWGVEDVSVTNIAQRFVSLPCGLVLAMNIDWCVRSVLRFTLCSFILFFRFQTIKGSTHSTGALYVTIKNNPPAIVNLMEETILVCVVPGPNEPSLEQLNSVLEPLISEIQELYQGMLG